MTVTSALGQVVADEFGIRLEFVRLIDAPVADVWSAVTDSDRLALWFGSWSGDPADGHVLLRSIEAPEDAYPDTVTIVECAAPHRLAVVLPTDDGGWPLTAELQPRGADGTFLLFTHRLAEPFDATSIGPGWHYYLDRLAAVVAGQPVPENWEDYHPALSGSYRLPE